MFEDFPCALTPAEKKALSSALGQGFFRQPLIGVKGFLTIVGTVAACALLLCVWVMVDHWHKGTGFTLFWAAAYFWARFMLDRRDTLIKRLYDHITSAERAAGVAPEDSGDRCAIGGLWLGLSLACLLTVALLIIAYKCGLF